MKRLIFLLSMSLFFSVHGWAQTTSNQNESSTSSADLAEASKLSQQALGLYNEKRYSEALDLAKRAVEIREKTLGSEHELVATSLSNVAEIYLAERKYTEAERFYKRSMSILESKWGPESNKLVLTLERLAMIRFSERDFVGAEKHYVRALAITEKSFGPKAAETGESLESLASFYDRSDQPKKAAEFYQRSLAVNEKLLAPADTRLVNLLYNCACALTEIGQRDKAKDYLERAQKNSPSPSVQVNHGGLRGAATLRVQPEYPIEAKNARITGVVVVEVVVDECGRVLKARSVKGPMELASAAARAAKEWRFNPTKLGGRPVTVIGTISFNFTR